MKAAHLITILLLPALLSGSGCTAMLWDRDNWDLNSHPAHNPDVRLFDSRRRKDVLVVYEEQRNHRSIQPRAYWLFENQYLVEREHRPSFVGTNAAIGLT